jgi:sec-independent protein translocase protein TatC
VVSQLALAVPMWLLFELGLLLAPVFVRVTRAPEEHA